MHLVSSSDQQKMPVGCWGAFKSLSENVGSTVTIDILLWVFEEQKRDKS
jgi:hypothetical protein